MAGDTTALGYEPIFATLEYDGRAHKLLKMAFCKGLLSFILKIKKFDPEGETYFEQEGWEHFKTFAIEIKRHYELEAGEPVAFDQILDLEKNVYKAAWKQISSSEEQIMYRVARDLEARL